ncbi:uncharacterized protein [Mytilus edulis]|uniref:uncharacterized protein n=1 Tax=Mytilus edulis TaxID=6550 RepID=UPI0039EE768B
MENHLVVLLLSVCVFLGAFYVNTIEQRIIHWQIKDELYGNEIKKVKEELESTRKAFTEMKVELESTTRNALKQAEVESGSTREQINILRKEMIEKDYARREEIFQIRPDVNALREELNEKGERPIFSYTAFTAAISTDGGTLSPRGIVKYRQVLANIGNCYDSSTGVFTVKTSGVYSVSASMMTPPDKPAHLNLMKNGQVLVWLYTGGSYDMASQLINVALSGGDELWIQQHSGSQLYAGQFYNLFTAAMIKPGNF